MASVKNIIHIDDDLDDIVIFQEVITKISPSYLLESFSDSKNAVEFLEQTTSKPDIIFLDINMPVMNGKETLLLIRRIKNLNEVPVVMYSTTIYGEDKKTFMELGANEFLKKASEYDGMKQEVTSLLKQFLKADI